MREKGPIIGNLDYGKDEDTAQVGLQEAVISVLNVRHIFHGFFTFIHGSEDLQ